MPPVPEPEPQKRGTRSAPLARLPFFESDAAIVAGVRAGQAAGGAALYDRYHRHVRRVLLRVLGPDGQLDDLVQETFLAAIDGIDKLEEPDALKGWLTGIAVFRARGEIRSRSRRRWLSLVAGSEVEQVGAPVSTPEIDEALKTTYLVLDRLGPDERIAFALRFVDGMELVEVADACSVSLATVKRRLGRAKTRFENIARTYPVLAEWIRGGSRWT